MCGYMYPSKVSSKALIIFSLIAAIVVSFVAGYYVSILYNTKTKGSPAPSSTLGTKASPTQSGFCGYSTYASCSADSDCIEGGCSGQICRGKREPGGITTCEWLDCYDETQYGLSCKCVSGRCQWAH